MFCASFRKRKAEEEIQEEENKKKQNEWKKNYEVSLGFNPTTVPRFTHLYKRAPNCGQ